MKAQPSDLIGAEPAKRGQDWRCAACGWFGAAYLLNGWSPDMNNEQITADAACPKCGGAVTQDSGGEAPAQGKIPESRNSGISGETITLAWPPSVNHYWRTVNGKPIISKRGRDYRKSVGVQVFARHFPRFKDQRLAMSIMAHPPDYRLRDLDNICKAILDSLQAANVYDSDSQIDDLRVVRSFILKPGAVIVSIGVILESNRAG